MSRRARTIKPELLEDAVAAAFSDMALRLFVSCIVLSDDYGRFRAEPSWLMGQIYWARSVDVDDFLSAMREVAAVVDYYEVNGQRYGQIRNWSKHQRIDKPGKPRIPPPPEDVGQIRETLASLSRNTRETLAPDKEKEKEKEKERDKEKDTETTTVVLVDTGLRRDDRIDDLWSHYVATRARYGRKTRKREPNREDRKAIVAALKSYDLETLKLSVDGLFLSDFHVGQDFTDIEYAMRATNVEKFAGAAELERRRHATKAPEPESEGGYVDPALIEATLAALVAKGAA